MASYIDLSGIKDPMALMRFRQLAEAMGIKHGVGAWQPIETAPKDGTEILAYDGFDRHIIYWCEEQGYWASKASDFSSPDLWQPLPEPPKGE